MRRAHEVGPSCLDASQLVPREMGPTLRHGGLRGLHRSQDAGPEPCTSGVLGRREACLTKTPPSWVREMIRDGYHGRPLTRSAAQVRACHPRHRRGGHAGRRCDYSARSACRRSLRTSGRYPYALDQLRNTDAVRILGPDHALTVGERCPQLGDIHPHDVAQASMREGSRSARGTTRPADPSAVRRFVVHPGIVLPLRRF